LTHIKVIFEAWRQRASVSAIALGPIMALPRQSEPAKPELILLPVTCASGEELKLLAHDLSLSGIKTTIAQNQNIDPAAYTASRGQYRGDMLLDQARQTVGGRVLVVTDADLYVPDPNFIFGMADPSGASFCLACQGELTIRVASATRGI
jgi:hypothetical protein